MARLILDAGVLIAGARGRVDVGALADTDDVTIAAVAAVAVAEYLAGTLLDPDPGRAAAQRAFLDEILDVVPVHPYDRAVANHHGELLAHVRRTGSRRGVHNLIVAATARAAGRTVLTTGERARSGELPGVAVRTISS